MYCIGQSSSCDNSSPGEGRGRRSRASTFPDQSPSPDFGQSFLERDRRRRVRAGANTLTSIPTGTPSPTYKRKDQENPKANIDLSASILNQLNSLENLSKRFSSLKEKGKKVVDGAPDTNVKKILRPKVASYPGRAIKFQNCQSCR